MDKYIIRECVAGWLVYVVKTQPKYDVAMVAATLDIKDSELLDVAREIVYEGMNVLLGRGE